MTTYGYIRVSTDEQAGDDRTSLATQRKKIEATATVADLEINQWVEEPGVSGGKALAERPAGGVMAAALVSGDTVIVSKLDRGFRNAADALNTAEDWKRRGIALIVADMGSAPVTENGVSKMFFGMLALVAEFERERIKERLAEGRAGKRLRGGHIGGSRPFGFEVEGVGREAHLVPNPVEQAAILKAKQLRAEGRSFRAISAALAEDGVAVSHEGVKQFLAREATNEA